MIKSEIKLSNLDKHIGTDVDSKDISWIGDNYGKKVSNIETIIQFSVLLNLVMKILRMSMMKQTKN